MKTSALLLVLLLAMSLLPVTTADAQTHRTVRATRTNTSIPLRDMKPLHGPQLRAPYAIPNRSVKFGGGRQTGAPDQPNFRDPALQAQAPTMGAPSVQTNFEGASDDDNAALLGFRIVPPDTQGDVGPNHYVQHINLVATIFDKSGNILQGPFAGNLFWQGMGGSCETENDGDPITLYDHLADRWVQSQFVASAPHKMCLAVSTTPDPTGSYYQYEFDFGNDFPDYPKLGVWDDAYYMTTRNFASGSFFTGVQAAALERDAMLNGQPAQMVVINVPGGTANDGWLPADLDGAAAPTGTPGIFAGGPSTAGSNEVRLYAFDVDWANTANSTLTQIAALPTDPYDTSISSIPQKKPGSNLDAIAAFLMHRLQYRNFGTHQTLVVNHTVDAGGNRAGIRWYELRDTGSGWSIYQQGTYAPDDGLHRWMGSIAMNGNGDLSLGYSTSAKNRFPDIRFTGQTVAQSGTGTMDVAETVIISGSGSQQQANRWGDYSAMVVDPSDDLTFWYTTEYYQNTAGFDFKSRIAAFTVGDSSPPPPPPPPPPPGTSMHVSSISTGQQGVGGGDKAGTANVTVVDENGTPVADASVTGTFSGDFNEGAGPEVTGGDGVAAFQTAGQKKGKVNVSFCVNTLTHASLTYDPGANANPGYDCGTGKRGGGTPALAAEGAEDGIPADFVLDQNYPNPFNPTTVLSYALPEAGAVTLRVYNLLGREVATLADGYQAAGRHEVAFDASRLSAGVYLYVLQADGFTATRRMTLLK